MIPLYSVNCVQDKDVIKFEYEVEIYVGKGSVVPEI